MNTPTGSLDRTSVAIDNILAGIDLVRSGLTELKNALSSDDVEISDFDPKDPANKFEIGGLEKLTERGAEICYRLFDAGKTRYAVAALMDISFGAASHRFKAWEKAGGLNRIRQPIE